MSSLPIGGPRGCYVLSGCCVYVVARVTSNAKCSVQILEIRESQSGDSTPESLKLR